MSLVMGNFKCYVVWVGHSPGLYYTWEECYAQVNGYPEAKYKGFRSIKEDEEALRGQMHVNVVPHGGQSTHVRPFIRGGLEDVNVPTLMQQTPTLVSFQNHERQFK